MNVFRQRIAAKDFKREMVKHITFTYRVPPECLLEKHAAVVKPIFKEKLLEMFDERKLLHAYKVRALTYEQTGSNGETATVQISGDVIEIETEEYLTALALQEEEQQRNRKK